LSHTCGVGGDEEAVVQGYGILVDELDRLGRQLPVRIDLAAPGRTVAFGEMKCDEATA
jgi:hypothetical protein